MEDTSLTANKEDEQVWPQCRDQTFRRLAFITSFCKDRGANGTSRAQATPDPLLHQVFGQLKMLSASSRPHMRSDPCASDTKRDSGPVRSRSKEFVLVFGNGMPIKWGS